MAAPPVIDVRKDEAAAEDGQDFSTPQIAGIAGTNVTTKDTK